MKKKVVFEEKNERKYQTGMSKAILKILIWNKHWGFPYTTTKQIRTELGIEGGNGSVDNTLQYLLDKEKIVKVGWGKWAVKDEIYYNLKNYFLKPEKRKTRFCSHLLKLENGTYKCKVTGHIIANPEFSCDMILVTLHDCYKTKYVPRCPGHYEGESNQITVQNSKLAFYPEIAKIIGITPAGLIFIGK